MPIRLSILLPVHDGARFLRQQVDSIVAQDDPDFELLAIDDGSRDASAAMLAELAADDARIRILPGDARNLGQIARLRHLLDAARGQHVAIADQDDIWDPARNRRLLDAIDARPVAFGSSHLIDSAGGDMGATLLDTLGLTPDPTARLRSLFKPMVSAHAAIFRRDWFDAAIWGSPLPFDWLMGTAALHGDGLAYVADAIVHHRIHGANQMNRAAPASARPLGAFRNRFAAMLRRPGQLRFWLMLDYLSRAPGIAPDRARLFAELALACRHRWFGAPVPHWQDATLRDRLATALSPLAGSDADLAAGLRQIDLLTRSLLHPAKAGAAVRRSWTPLETEF